MKNLIALLATVALGAGFCYGEDAASGDRLVTTVNLRGAADGSVPALLKVNYDTKAGSTSISSTDATGSIQLSKTAGAASAVVKAPDGTVEFSGPFGTAEERALAPDAVRNRIEALEQRAEVTRLTMVARQVEIRGGGAGGNGGGAPGMMTYSRGGAETKTVRKDANGIVEIVRSNGVETATTRDSAGNTVFTGPFNSEDERAAAGAERARIEQSESLPQPVMRD